MTAALFVGSFLAGSGANVSYGEELAQHLEGRGWTIVRTSAQVSKPRRLADMLYTTCARRDDYACAHVSVFSGLAFAYAEAVSFALRRLHKPFVLTLHGGNLPHFARRWPRRTRRLLRSAERVTAPSGYLAAELGGHGAAIEVVPNAVDTSAFAFIAREQPSARLVWVRAFHAIYNPLLAIDVLARLRAARPDATLDMFGPDQGDGTLERARARIRELGLDAAVTIHGAVPKATIPGHLARFDLLINTTDVDNTPISILEALASGLCVVSTAVGGIPYLLAHDRTALLVPPRDPEAMVAAVLRVLDEPGLAARLSRAGHAFAKSCDWTPVLDRWTSVLEELAHG